MKFALKKQFSLRRGTAAVAVAPVEEGAEETDEEADVAPAEQAQLQDWVRPLAAPLGVKPASGLAGIDL